MNHSTVWSRYGGMFVCAYLFIVFATIAIFGLFGENFASLFLGMPLSIVFSVVINNIGIDETTPFFSYLSYVLIFPPIVINAILFYVIGYWIEGSRTRARKELKRRVNLARRIVLWSLAVIFVATLAASLLAILTGES